MCSSSGGQNCIIQPLVSSNSVGGRPVHRLREDPCTGRPPIGVMIPEAVRYNFDLMTMSTWRSEHVEAWNKFIVRQILCIRLVNYQDKSRRTLFVETGCSRRILSSAVTFAAAVLWFSNKILFNIRWSFSLSFGFRPPTSQLIVFPWFVYIVTTFATAALDTP